MAEYVFPEGDDSSPKRATYPRDRWIGASSGGNVTQGGKALEVISEIKNYLDDHKDSQLTDGERAVMTDISTIISSVNLDG